jgi:hypothetical protein
MRMKRRMNAKGETKKKEEQPKMFGNTVQACEEGLSPKLTFGKKKRTQQTTNTNDDDSSDS